MQKIPNQPKKRNKKKQKENERKDKELGKLEDLDEEEYTYTSNEDETSFELMYDKYRKLKNSDQLYKDLLKQYKSELIDEQRYYIPILSLLVGNKAKLDLYITTEYSIDKIEIKVVGSTTDSITLDKYIFEKVQTGKGDLNITVTCQQEFTEPLTLEVYRFAAGNAEGELCGKLILIPNSKIYQKEIKIVLVKILTRLNKEDNIISKIKLQEIREGVTKFFAQALLIPQFEEIEIPLYDDAAQTALVQNSVILTDSDCVNMGLPKGSRALTSRGTKEFSAKVHQMIKERIPKEIEKQYKQYFKAFLVEEPLYTKSGDYIVERSQQGGASLHTDRGNLICFRAGNDSTTVTHEFFHSMGLGHIFSDFNAEKYCFKMKYTSNLMDYSKKRISIYYWQWKRINKNIK